MCTKPPHIKLFGAVEAQDLNAVEAILSKGSVDLGFQHPDMGGASVLHRAARHTEAGIFNALLRAGADPLAISKDGKTALMTAVYFGNVKTVKSLLNLGIGDLLGIADDSRSTAFHYCSQQGHSEILSMLIEASGEEVNTLISSRDAGNNTPLHKAAIGGHVDAVRLLLKSGAESSVKNFDDMTPAQCCIFFEPKGYEACMAALETK
jgi:cytohesin